MSIVQSSVASDQPNPFGAEPKRLGLDWTPVVGLGLFGLGLGLFCLGIFHGFAHGSCSTTGYSGNYGPVPTCASGTGWWMLMLMAGLVVAGIGAVFARGIGAILLPLLFVAIGVPFIALAFGNHGHLMFNSSTGTGKIFSGVFGACFVIAGLIWGAFAVRGISGVSSSSVLGGVLAAVVGLGIAFAISTGVSSAIGKTTTPSSVQVAPGVHVLSAAAERAREISLCKDIVAAQRLVSAPVKATLTAECATNWKAAERAIPAAAKKAALAYTAAQCTKGIAASGLPTGAGSAAAGVCKHPEATSQGKGLKSAQQQICRQIVMAQVPAAARPQALAACRKL